MVVHLSPKAKALTLPLNWSQFLKTLIGAENYTLFQLPPEQDQRPPCAPSFTQPRYTLLPLLLLLFPLHRRHHHLDLHLLVRPISATRIFLFPP